MRDRIRGHDWHSSPLGARESWPQVLQTAIDLILDSPIAMAVLWGEELTQIYNDAYGAIIGKRHPDGLGKPRREAWPELWDFQGPVFNAVFKGEHRFFENCELTLWRHGYEEQTWFDLSYSPIRDEKGNPAGVLVCAVETTQRVQNARCDRFRTELEKRLRMARRPKEVLVAASEQLGLELAAGQVAYADVEAEGDFAVFECDWNNGAFESNAGRLDLRKFGPALTADLKAGQTLAIGDVSRDPRTSSPDALAALKSMSIAAFIKIPLIKDGKLVALLAIHSKAPRTWLAVDIALAEETAERTWAAVEHTRAEAVLREREEMFRTFADASSDVVWIVNADTSQIRYLSPAYESVWGEPRDRIEADVSRFWELIHPDDRARVAEVRPQAFRGKTYTVEYRVVRPADGATRWIKDTAFPIRNAAGQVCRVAGIARDVTQTRQAIERQKVLVAELQHRTRNLLAVVTSIANQTKASRPSLEGFMDAFGGRLMVLSRVQGLLSRSDQEPSTIGSVVSMELAALDSEAFEGRIAIHGPKVFLPNPAVQMLALALHELATNARQHGALAGGSGSLSVHWCLRDGDRTLDLAWEERGVVIQPEARGEIRRGFGRELLEWALPYTLGAKTAFQLGETGLRFQIELPLEDLTEGESVV